MTDKKYSFSASSFLLIVCGVLLIIALVAALASFLIPKTAAVRVQNATESINLGAYTAASSSIDVLGYKTASLSIGTTTISVEIANTQALQNQGLSDRTSLGADDGMLFVFRSDSEPNFWMKDMDFSLDMIWIDASGTVVDITHDISPASYPSTVSPTSPVRYVIEVNAGFSQSHDIVVGSHVKIS